MSPSAVRITNLGHELVPCGSAVLNATIAGTAGTLTSLGSLTLNAKTKVLQIAVDQAVRVDPAGGTPTASVGQPVLAGQVVRMSLAEFQLAKWIRVSSSATAQISEYTY